MSIYAISDLHLSFNTNKPMNVFGDIWRGYENEIRNNWLGTVKENDIVILPGDFSWETYLENTFLDFKYINELPGKKLLLKGNHDYWWTTLTKMRKFLKDKNFENIDFIYNNSYIFDNYIIAGTRGWSVPLTKEDSKIIKREKIRLRLSIEDGIKKYGNNIPIIVCMHYPPTKEFIDLMKNYNIKKCVYGHLHGNAHKNVQEGIVDGIELIMTSCDYTKFNLIKLT